MNKHGRPTTDKKWRDINIRLNGEMRQWLEERASRSGVSMSEYIRDLIRQDMKFQDSSK